MSRLPRRSAALLAVALSLAVPAVGGAQELPSSAAGGDAGPAPVVHEGTRAGIPAALFGEEVVRAARRHLGTRYVWGGERPGAFDCSGFVQWVFGERGVRMPRTAREQAGVGDAPYPGDLRPGDLLFFWGGTGAQHVAIYAGGDSIIHASSRSRRVQFDRMRGTGMQRDWFGRRLIAVRRVLPATAVFSSDSTSGRDAASRRWVASPARTRIFAGGTR